MNGIKRNTYADAQTDCSVKKVITITAPATFEIQHYTQLGRSTDGLGVQNGIGTSEVYTTVEIIRLK